MDPLYLSSHAHQALRYQNTTMMDSEHADSRSYTAMKNLLDTHDEIRAAILQLYETDLRCTGYYDAVMEQHQKQLGRYK